MSDVKPPVSAATPFPGPASQQPPPASSSTSAALHVTSVLLVDDQPSNLLALEAILEPLGQNLVRAHSGKEALKHLLSADFSVILLDVQMPELDGFETASLIKDRAKSRHIPIIFLTAISKEASYVARGYNVGAVDYITKPFEPDALRQKVSVFVDLFRKNETIRQQAEALREHREREFAEIKRASDQRYRQLAESMPQVVWMADAHGELTYGNRRWYASAAGRAMSELSAGPRWEQVLHPDDLAAFLETFSAATTKGQDWEAQYRFGSLEPGVHRWHRATGGSPRGSGRTPTSTIASGPRTRCACWPTRALSWASRSTTRRTCRRSRRRSPVVLGRALVAAEETPGSPTCAPST
jgi:PAS domain S-box-containing protein